jgi:hypothetical protein
LLELCRNAQAEDSRSVAAFADAFLSMNEVVLAARMVSTREELLALYCKRIDTAWPIVGSKHLMMDKNGNCTLAIRRRRDMTDLEPLRGMPFVRLLVEDCANLRDLDGLRGMPLKSLQVNSCPQVTNLTALQGLQLTDLALRGNGRIKDLSPLKGMKLTSLTLIGNGVPSKELDVLRRMPLNKLHLANIGIREPSFLTELPLLTDLAITWYLDLKSLAPLKGLKLTRLDVSTTSVSDLSPLEGMPLEYLNVDECSKLKDLTPLSKILTLTSLVVSRTEVKKLSPLAGLKLQEIILNHEKFPEEEMAVLRQMTSLKRINKMPVAAFWKKYPAGGGK